MMVRSKWNSIRVQFSVVIFLLILGVILFCYLFNNFFLESYYKNDKERVLMNAYERLNQAASDNTMTSDDFDVELVRMTSADNLGVIVMDANSKTVKCYASDTGSIARRLWENLFTNRESEEEGSIEDSSASDAEGDAKSAQLISDGKTKILESIDETDTYHLQTVLDQRTNSEYMELWGILENGNLFLLQTPLESIHTSVEISNRFLFYIGLLAAVLGAVAAMLISQRLTKPIRTLSKLSERMRDLDFTAKYQGGGNNEISELGENFNELSSTLEQTISELKTANNELRKDIEQKDKIDEMRKEFLSNVSHELKTPIALIQGYAEGLQDDVNDDEESRNFYCEVIMDEAAKMNTMVKKLLTLNQLEFGNNQVSMEHFDIVAVIRNYLQSAALLAANKEVHIQMEETNPIYVWADEFLAEEVFQNYYSNALQHVDGEKIIDIRFEIKPEVVRIVVFNTGQQIPEDSIPHLWEKFYKVDKARTREYGGSGVGLSIVKAIMDSLHRDCGVENYENGVAFWFELDTISRKEKE